MLEPRKWLIEFIATSGTKMNITGGLNRRYCMNGANRIKRFGTTGGKQLKLNARQIKARLFSMKPEGKTRDWSLETA